MIIADLVIELEFFHRLLDFYSPDSLPPEPVNRVRKLAYNITTGGELLKQVHTHYEPFMMGCIMVNVSFALSQVHNMSELHSDIMFYQEVVFTIIFLSDILLKLVALGPYHFVWNPTSSMLKRWNLFDVLVIALMLMFYFCDTMTF